jgi:hypothetical protein
MRLVGQRAGKAAIQDTMEVISQRHRLMPQLCLRLVKIDRFSSRVSYANANFGPRRSGGDDVRANFHACHRELIAYQPQVSFELINFMELIGECMGNGE